jgi:hypothetical protein
MRQLRSGLVTLLAACSVSVALGQVANAPPDSSIPYSTLDEALKALREKPGVTFRDQDGWVVAEDMQAPAVWLFTPPGHPAYPSMVRRRIVNGPDGASFETSVRCLASKDVCDMFFGEN